MARIDSSATVVDAGPLIHLDEMACLDLLSDFSPLVIAREVRCEVLVHRPHLSLNRLPGSHVDATEYTMSARLSVMAGALGLAAGEVAALALAESKRLRRFLTDDAAARVAGESLGLQVHGTLGVIVRSIRRCKRSKDQVLRLLRDIPSRSTLHISRRLLDEVIRKVEEKVAEGPVSSPPA